VEPNPATAFDRGELQAGQRVDDVHRVAVAGIRVHTGKTAPAPESRRDEFPAGLRF
jgi:hypothetical protein